MLRERPDVTKLKLRDIVLRRERGLPVLDDEHEALANALHLIEVLEKDRPFFSDDEEE